jgi:transposase InsO family protein
MGKQYAFLFNVSLYHRISFLETIAATELITNPARDCYQVTPEAVKKILQITSGHPYYTQLVCHCMFDRWIRSPKPAMTVEDVDTVLAEAIELGSANLTHVWDESTPEEQALMAGMAAAMRTVTGPVTVKQIREAWRDVGVSLPERNVAKAIRSLTNREVITGDQTYSFAVYLQRLWLDKHRRLDWVKEELTQALRDWDQLRIPRLSRRRTATTLAAALVIALAAGAAWQLARPASHPTPQLTQTAPQLTQTAPQLTQPTTCTVPASYFMFNTAELVDPVLTAVDLTPCIKAAIAAHATFALDGWTSYEGPLNANGKPAIDYPYNRTLSKARVQAIANLLVKYLGVPRAAITHLAGHGNVNQPYPTTPRSSKNRVVIIRFTIK